MEAREILHTDHQWTYHTRFTLSSGLVTLHCSIQRTKCARVNHETNTPSTPSDYTPINSAKDLIDAYPDQFDRIGNFAGEYHIVLRPNNHPIVHAPRKCPIHIVTLCRWSAKQTIPLSVLARNQTKGFGPTIST